MQVLHVLLYLYDDIVVVLLKLNWVAEEEKSCQMSQCNILIRPNVCICTLRTAVLMTFQSVYTLYILTAWMNVSNELLRLQ